jgi:hypothetical protein
MQNFGIINETFKNILADSIVSKSEKGKKVFRRYIKALKENRVFRTQYNIYNKLENKVETDRFKSGEYVHESIKVLKNLDKDVILNENSKLISYLTKFGYEVSTDDYPYKELHENIHSLVVSEETAKNLDIITESSHFINNYIKNNTKPVIAESTGKFFHQSTLGNELYKKFNERYADKLNESEKRVFKVVTDKRSTEEDKKNLYADMIRECIELVNEQLKECNIEEKDKLLQVKDKLLRFKYNKDKFVSEISKIVNLKGNLI